MNTSPSVDFPDWLTALEVDAACKLQGPLTASFAVVQSEGGKYTGGLPLDRPLSLAIGIFDGVHLGHQAVIDSALNTARSQRGWSAVLTFTPHPSRVLGSPEPTRLLMPEAVKTERLLECGLDAVIWKVFNREYAAIGHEDFLPLIKQAMPGLKSIHVGANFRFGQKRLGDIHHLNAAGKKLGTDVFSVERIQHNGEAISSSRIRDSLAEGQLAAVNILLGRPYECHAVVEQGKKMGRQLGFPTLNLTWDPEARPCFGVYAVEVAAASGEWFPAVANYGLRPTVEESLLPRLEVHLLGEPIPSFGPGDALKVRWLSFFRPERRFGGVDELRSAIATDKEKAIRYFQR